AGGNRGEDGVVVRDAAVRDPALLAAQDVAALGARRRGLDRGGVGSGAGLGDRDGGERRSLARERRDPAPPLLLRAEDEHRLREEAARGEQVADPGAAEAELLLRDALRQEVGQAAPAVLLGEHER